ncbi:MAG: cation diffusion facilitator family transporter [Patescibacteria group bacterium]
MTDNHTHSNKLGIGIFLNLLITALEYGAGFLSGSLVLVSDASHNLTDVVSLIVASVAEKVSKRKSNQQKTYGYARATILGALLNTVLFFLLALYVFYEAYNRLRNPSIVSSNIIIVVGFVTAVFNGFMAFVFSHDKKDLNTRGVFLHQIYDTISSVGAVVAGILVYFTHNPIFDPLVSVMIGLMMLSGGWNLAKKTLHILLEGVPEDINAEEVKQSLLNLPHVKKIHDLHIWSLSSHFVSLSCHIVIDDSKELSGFQICRSAKKLLEDKYRITHTTIEIEITDCEGEVCEIESHHK